MAIRYLLLAALVGSAFSAHAAPGPIYASTGAGTVLLATTTTGHVQTYMPHAVQSFVMFMAPAAAAPATALLGGSVQSTVPPASAPAELNLADLVGVGVATPIASELPLPEVDADFTGGGSVAVVGPTELALDATAVPEPGTGGLMLAGLAGVGFMARRRRSR